MSKFTLNPLRSILRKPSKLNWLIKGHMEVCSLGMLFGAPASCKSFLAMDISYCIASGLDWNGNKTQQGSVVYIAGEGFRGMALRFKALEIKYGTKVNNIYLSKLPASLSDREKIDEVYNAIRRTNPTPKLIVIDTLHRNFGPGEENSAGDFGKFLFNITALMKVTGSSILIVHHSGHGSADRSRGSSSIRGSMDVEYKAVNNQGLVTMSCTKAKEFPEPKPASFDIITQPINTWLDDDGNPVESAILQSTTYTPPIRQPSLSKKDALVLQALDDVTVKKGVAPTSTSLRKHPELAGRNYIHITDWRSEAYLLLDKDNGIANKTATNLQAFNRAKIKLLNENVIAEDNSHFWEVI